MISWLIIILAGVGSLFLTRAIRGYALSRGLLDIPNERSSHDTPTPRGGGVAIVLMFLAGLLALRIAGIVPVSLFWGLSGAGALAAIIGWVDDLRDMPAGFRLAGHFISAILALFWMGGLPPLPVMGMELNLGIAGHMLAALYLVWLLNLYNFMDGIDGIAGMEALTVCLCGAVLYRLFMPEAVDWVVPLLMAGAVAGFLVWNFPKAKIFMGDVGSGFIGMVLGVMTIQAAWLKPELFWGWLILLGAFIVDASVTLVRRAWHGEKVYQAHRSHAYQHAARKARSHVPVTLAFAGINLLWLFPLALMVALYRLDGFVGLIIAYIPLVAAAFWFKAGVSW